MKKKLITFALCAGALGGGVFFATSTEAAPKCPNGPDYTYISRSTAQCAAIRFVCPEGEEPFFNECGCGCKTIGS